MFAALVSLAWPNGTFWTLTTLPVAIVSQRAAPNFLACAGRSTRFTQHTLWRSRQFPDGQVG
jgi:hypothetical protein